MKQPVHPRHPRNVETSRDSDSTSSRPVVEVVLTETEKLVLEQLGSSGRAMTSRQLETAIGCAAQELAQAVEGLLRASLISRLNTVIPSYVNKYPGVRIYGE
ncbi:MAG: hypothetical protein M1274_09610 [Actinobacteria bacterium]|nr:hypothetical protein [Actinomycetota bacterium]